MDCCKTITELAREIEEERQERGATAEATRWPKNSVLPLLLRTKPKKTKEENI